MRFLHMATRLASTHQGRLVCSARRPAHARDEHFVRSSPQCYRAQVVRDERVAPPRWQPTGVSHRAGASVQLGTVSASGPARWPVWRGSGRRARTDTRLVSESANSHLGRLSLSGDALHHIIRWNVEFSGWEGAVIARSYCRRRIQGPRSPSVHFPLSPPTLVEG